ncbi:hypothetical protein FEM48_Zijuj02G0151700 [Ziziphus jujuba var. spinosa]|uniref:F-box/LRR-repeat protein 15/At3g58940/PEG3-like LRR domain-containing protein n=1 Tax=Ziziphus jujuba var. spinosa TaxID=714518 RepID=A0A978VWE5_ZIZJJ|nr:hypothetical protein FEM48_Zijuj02G0151700 [Ziziphus jujuba var. spinosa]
MFFCGRRVAPTLHEFSVIAVDLRSDERHHIEAWMDFAAEKHVKELTLKLNSLMFYDASFIVDNFHSLRVLYLEGINITADLVHRLFSNSPILERFSLLSFIKLHRLSIVSAPNLNSFYIGRCRDLQHLEISSSAENLNTIQIIYGVNFESVNVSAPNLSHIILAIHGRAFKLDAYVTLLSQIKRLTFDWLHMYIPKEVEVNQNHACEYLKVVKLNNFAGSQYEVEFLLDLLEYAVSVEKIFIGFMGSSIWGRHYEDKFDNQYEELCIECAQQLKTKIIQMHPNAEVYMDMISASFRQIPEFSKPEH